MTDGTILYRREGNTCLIKLVGCIRFTVSPRFESFIHRMFVTNAPESVTIDLTETDHIDSTNLGLLARIARYVAAHSDRRPVIRTDREDILLLLETMGFDQVFTIDEKPAGTSDDLDEIPGGEGPQAVAARTILDAHEALMRMNESNRARFQDVVEMMGQDVSSEPGAEGDMRGKPLSHDESNGDVRQ